MKFSLKTKIVSMAFSAIFAAIIAIVSQVFIVTPIGIPLTFQVFAVAVCGYVLRAKWGCASVAVYIILGLSGIPVFSGFKGGIHNLFGLTGGFIIGFLALAFFCGLGFHKPKMYTKILFGIIGLIICHLCGIVQFSLISNSRFTESAITVSLPYLIKDIILVVAAAFISKHLEKYVKV